MLKTSCSHSFWAIFGLFVTQGFAAMPVPSHLRCEALETPALVDTPTPRFSWQMESTVRGVKQAAYQLRLGELGADGKPIGKPKESAKVASDQSQWLEFPSFVAKPKSRYQWQVRIWDGRGEASDWTAPMHFETSLLGGDWSAMWLSDGRPAAKMPASAARYFRKTFELKEAPIRAKLYLSAFGLVDPWLNGSKVTEDLFLPGWPDYTKRNFYVAYDVTKQLQLGQNAIGLILGEGWYGGSLMGNQQAGATPLVSGWLEIVDRSGKTTRVATDETWQWAHGPITGNGLYSGETFDARLDHAGWSKAEGCDWKWQAVKVEPKPVGKMIARYSQPVRRIEELKPISRREVRPGVFLYDLGQNMVGWVRLNVKAAPGQKIQMRFGEMLEKDKTLFTRNLRSAKATATYIARGGEEAETWEPEFTYFGFRYVELSGVTAPLDDAITGVVVHSDLPRIGHFECSNPLINRLYLNALWSQKGNSLDVPTDCPQRDERLGWTGDAQIFCNTANYNLQSGAFYRQWLAAVRDGYQDGEDGGYRAVAPGTIFPAGSAGWADAGVIVPWVTWLHTGDRRILEENFPTIQKWIALQKSSAPEGIRRSKPSYGDWLAPGYPPGSAPTPYVLIATAFYAHSTQLAGKMAEVLGDKDAAEEYGKLFDQIKAAFCKEFISSEGKMTSDEQTAYLLALGFDLVPEELQGKVAAHLEHAIKARDNHLATGFIGTPLLAPVLTEIGKESLAYQVLLQESYPGWLFPVKNGATTMWERWDGWTPEQGCNSDDMNSFNHYAFGSVAGWFYGSIAGLKPMEEEVGWKKFEIAPIPGGGLTKAEGSVETPYGIAKSSWNIVEGRFELTTIIPANTQARVTLPTHEIESVFENGTALTKLPQASDVQVKNGKVSFMLGSGRYDFVIKNN